MCACFMYHVVQTWLVLQLLNLILTPVSLCSWKTRTNTRSNPNTVDLWILLLICVVFTVDSKTRPKIGRKNCAHYFFIPRTIGNYSWKWQKVKKYFCPCKSAQRIFCKTPCEKIRNRHWRQGFVNVLKLFRVPHTPALSFSYIRCKYKTNVKAFIYHSMNTFHRGILSVFFVSLALQSMVLHKNPWKTGEKSPNSSRFVPIILPILLLVQYLSSAVRRMNIGLAVLKRNGANGHANLDVFVLRKIHMAINDPLHAFRIVFWWTL